MGKERDGKRVMRQLDEVVQWKENFWEHVKKSQLTSNSFHSTVSSDSRPSQQL